MSHIFKRRKKKSSSLPGTLEYTGERIEVPTKINLIKYNEQKILEEEIKSPEDYSTIIDEKSISWINIDGFQQLGIIAKIGSFYKIHPLVLEDILNVNQRPKIELFDNYICIILKLIEFEKNTNELSTEQISIIFGSNLVISFKEKESEIFIPIAERIQAAMGQIRKMKSDYLVYSLLDIIIDDYFEKLEKLGERIEILEVELIEKPTTKTLNEIYNLKNNFITLRKSIWPLREIINRLLRRESPLIHEHTEIYYRDIYDHIIQIVDTIEIYRDMLSNMLDIYLSSVSNRMNEIMKVLTIIATIFIPLTFITSLYGMNFINMPELNWDLGYPMILILLLIIAISMLIYFKKKKWL